MSTINILDFATANLIAAGEVVERPASVVKELAENSIDAGATRITVEIRGGGVAMIRVTDDGCGMSEDDLPRCILRHATSKIATGDDLAAIGTLGFRGEALAATAAVSRMKIITKRKQDGAGHRINVNYGVCSTVSECGAPDGTAVTVSELFSNVPARRKFLKADRTEAAAVSSVCEKLALSALDVSFTLISDGVRKFSTAGDGVLKNAVYAIFGRSFANGSISIKGASDGINVSGIVASPVMSRPNRGMEMFFINGRYVKSQIISNALESALDSYIPVERFPFAALFVTIHPALVDVNVHPSKLEVKFSSERPVFDAVYYAVKSSVTENTVRPELDVRDSAPKLPQTVSPFIPVSDEYTKTEITQISAFDRPQGLRSAPFSQPQTYAPPVYSSAVYGTPDKAPQPEEPEEDPDPAAEWRFIGEAFDTYLFVETGDDVLIIDKHAAHERLNFEELKRKMKEKTATSQQRMIPVEAKLTEEEEDAAERYRAELEAAGYAYTAEDRTVQITATPADLDEGEAAELFINMLSNLAAGTESPGLSRDMLFERALYQASCKGAIKGGDKNERENLIALIDRLMKTPNVTYCPHGRPVAFRMSKAALERRFGRT